MSLSSQFIEAQNYVGNPGENYFIVGLLQLEMLRMNGCIPDSNVLEIGCGALVAGRPVMQFLNANRYVGIEPNTWLLDAVNEGLPDTKRLIAEKLPIFLDNLDFDASKTGRKFDYVFSHSILSHAATHQLSQFFKAIRKSIAPHGVVLASIRFFDDNNQLMGDSNDQEWQYPGVTASAVSFFSWETVQRVAGECGFAVEWRKDYREFFTKFAPSNYHDWIRLQPLQF